MGCRVSRALAFHGLFIAFGFPQLLTMGWVVLIASGIMFAMGVQKDDMESV
jgi:hypothetical protein